MTARWDEMASFREQRRAWIDAAGAPVTEWLIEALDLQRDETLLELAAGAGGVGFAILQRLGGRIRLIASDISAATLQVARRAARETGLAGVDFRTLDGQRMDLPSATLDAVVCRWGYMLMDDPLAAFRETGRVLRPGGRVAFSVWAAAEGNPWTTIDNDICSELGFTPPSALTDPGGMFSLADPVRLRALVEESELVVRRLEAVGLSWIYESAEEYLAIEIDVPGARGDFWRGLAASVRDRAVRLASELLAPFQLDGAYVVPGETLNVLAVRR